MIEKPWRLHLANSAIQTLDLIPGDPALLSVWPRDGKASFYDADLGALHGSMTLTLPDSTEKWWPFLTSLKTPKGKPVPHARVGGVSIWRASDGKAAVAYHGGLEISLYTGLESPQTLRFDVTPAALTVDPDSQLVAALDPKGALLLGKPGGALKTLKPGLTPLDDLPLTIVIGRSGKRMVVSDGMRLVVIDGGKVSSRRELHYACGLMALSPSGETLLTFDTDSGVLRAYNPDALKLTHQKFVADLVGAAEELQLVGFADPPPNSAALSALTVDDAGRLAFAIFGQVCAAGINHMTPTSVTPDPSSFLAEKPASQPNVKAAVNAKPTVEETPKSAPPEAPKSPATAKDDAKPS